MNCLVLIFLVVILLVVLFSDDVDSVRLVKKLRTAGSKKGKLSKNHKSGRVVQLGNNKLSSFESLKGQRVSRKNEYSRNRFAARTVNLNKKKSK